MPFGLMKVVTEDSPVSSRDFPMFLQKGDRAECRATLFTH